MGRLLCENGIHEKTNQNICSFTLDGVTYKAIENPDDGYRSYMEELEVSDRTPINSFHGVGVVCSMKENTEYENNDILVIRDAHNGKTILEIGTENYDDYYPCCQFVYHPENMMCNAGKDEQNG